MKNWKGLSLGAAITLLLTVLLTLGTPASVRADDTHYARIHFTTSDCAAWSILGCSGAANNSTAGVLISSISVKGYNQNGDWAVWDSTWAWGHNQSPRLETTTEGWWWDQTKGLEIDFQVVNGSRIPYNPNNGWRSCLVSNSDTSIYSLMVVYDGTDSNGNPLCHNHKE